MRRMDLDTVHSYSPGGFACVLCSEIMWTFEAGGRAGEARPFLCTRGEKEEAAAAAGASLRFGRC